MRTFLLSHLFLLLPVLSYGQAASAPAAPASLPPIMQTWAEAQKKVGDIHVAFRQTRTVPSLKAPVVTQGQFWRFQDGAFRWELGQPAGTILVYDMKEFRVRETGSAEWQVLDPKDGRYRMWAQFLGSNDASTDSMAKNFTVKVTSETADAVTVSMNPRPLLVRRYLKLLELQIHPKSMRLLQIRILQADGATVVMTFSEPQKATAAERARLLAR